MKKFCFKQFEIQQSEDVFRVGTDGVLLGALASVDKAKRVLEIGTGTGLISLMLAQRNSYADILGIDISSSAAAITKSNFETSPFSSRLRNVCENFRCFESVEKFDLVISNPPYFEASDSMKDKIARQTVELNFEQLITGSSALLSTEGAFSVIIPADVERGFADIAFENGLFVIRKVNIRGIANSKIKRLILEFSLTEKALEESEFIIEKSPRQYSDQYIELTKEFHVFKNT